MKFLLIIFLFSCSVSKPDHQEQARLISIKRVADNKGILKLKTVTGKQVIWYNKVRGLGKAKWVEGNKYTVEFLNNKIVKITENE